MATLGGGVLVEVFLRLGAGIQPWQSHAPAGEPVIHEPDSVLGWRNRPGEYIFPLTTVARGPVTMHFRSDGSRVTGLTRPQKTLRVVLLGCSLTQGWTLSDDETYA
jgi:hypothetical protein